VEAIANEVLWIDFVWSADVVIRRLYHNVQSASSQHIYTTIRDMFAAIAALDAHAMYRRLGVRGVLVIVHCSCVVHFAVLPPSDDALTMH
jgi:hypothetical protein